MNKILVTGGCGYIGGHTIVDLIQNGFDVISVDDLSRGSLKMLDGIEQITEKKVKNYKVDLCDLDDTEAIFLENPDLVGVIHFAAYKSVPESVNEPLKYFHNNFFQKSVFKNVFQLQVQIYEKYLTWQNLFFRIYCTWNIF